MPDGRIIQVRTVRDLLSLRPEDILSIKNLGDCTLQEIYHHLARNGFVREGFHFRETSEERKEIARKLRVEQLRSRIGYRSY